MKNGIKRLTADQFQEFLNCGDPISGPLHFLDNYCYVNKNGIVKFTPYDYQIVAVDNINKYKDNILLFSRQLGKCLFKSINISIRNKKTGELKDISIGDFYELCKEKAKRKDL